MRPHAQSRAQHQESAWLDPARVRWIKVGIIAVIVVGLGVLAYFVMDAIQSEQTAARWDEFARIKNRFEPTDAEQDPLFEDSAGTYHSRRETYIATLEAFLETVEDEDEALAAQVHWLLAKLSADQVISMKDEINVGKRRAYWEKAREHMQVIHDRYTDYQTNWAAFAPSPHASLTRAVLSTIKENMAWEKTNFPAPREPAEDLVVVVRTERGDIRMGLYRDEAKGMTDLFLERALDGDYDGTAFFARTGQEASGAAGEATIRGGHPATRGARPWAREQHIVFAQDEHVGDHLLPAESRWLIPIDRGVVCAWHDPASEYDGPQPFLVAARRSPLLDYRYSPIGKLLDVASQDTVDRIFAGEIWADDPLTDLGPDTDIGVGDFLQAPVRIVKVLVYENGRLLEPEDAEVGPHKVPIVDAEKDLPSLEPDAYRAEPPAKPKPHEGGDEEPPPSDDGEQAEKRGESSPGR